MEWKNRVAIVTGASSGIGLAVARAFASRGARVAPDLVFSQPMSTAEQVADAVVGAIETGEQEISLPAMSGKLAPLGYLLPGFYSALRPLLEKRGAKNKKRYLERKRTGGPSRG